MFRRHSHSESSSVPVSSWGREWRGDFLFVLAAVCLIAMVGRLAYVHAVLAQEGTELATHLARQQRATLPIPARRGEILDAAGRVLAGSQDRPSIFADPAFVQDPAEVSRKVAPILGMRHEVLCDKLLKAKAEDCRFVWLLRRGDEEQERAIRELNLAGIGIIVEPFRRYPMHSVAAHVIGFVNIDDKGLEGIERRYDELLQGTPGSSTVYRDAARRPMWTAEGREGYVAPRDGMSLQLTIDSAIQEILEQQVAAAVEHFNAASGVGLVMNPTNGHVLGMASVPTYDPNEPGASPGDARRNRVLTDPCEPGSTFKPFVASAALAENVVRRGEIINCKNGAHTFGPRRLHDHHPYGDLTYEQILIKSSNIGMAFLGERLGNERIHRYLSAPFGFGFGSKTGIDLDGEDSGQLLPLRKWTSYSTTSLPMGQEISVTPLQLANSFCTLVNGGKLLRPRVVRAILDPQGQLVEAFTEPEVVRQVIPTEIADYISKTVLVAVVNEGTGRRAELDQYQVLGKTGTAQIARKDGRGFEPGAYTSSFIAAAPASDPEVVVLVMIRKPKRHAYYGGTVAAPAVREVIRRSLAYLGTPPDKSPMRAMGIQQVHAAR
ncbi:MAG: penicillin-binding protein 2 [Phycisphaerae bacterium]|nr:penicillin-binding protein 2 [Phycisphaerae bacterium]